MSRCVLRPWHVLALAVSCLLPSFIGGQSKPVGGAIPDGWYVYPEEKLKHLDETTLRCFMYSRSEWKVTSEDDVVTIASNHADQSDELPLPPLLKHEQGMPGRTVRAGLRSALHFNNDWLLAYDGGEWGGGLWLTNEDGTKTKQILGDNVQAIIPIDDGLLVLSGLAHLSINFGNAFFLSNPDGMNISLQHAFHLDGAPSVYAKELDGAVVFVTTYGLWKITKSGELVTLAYFPNWTRQQYPNSMAVTSDGSIFIGMRMFVMRLRTDGGHYKEEWLLPEKCRKFELDKLNCVCKP